MTPDTRLPRVVAWLARALAPAHNAGDVAAELEDDYTRVRGHRSAFGAAVWLGRETVSLLVSYTLARWRRLTRSGPLWARDLQLLARGFRRGPFAALAAAAMLSTGLLAVVLTAGLAQTLLFRPVSARHGDAVRRLAAIDRLGNTTQRFSFAELTRVRERLGETATLTSVVLQPIAMRRAQSNIQTMAEIVDGNYFAVTGMAMMTGRGLLTTDNRAGAPRVVVIAQPFWHRLGKPASILGSELLLNGTAYTVVGVAASLGSSSFLGASVDAWVPVLQADPLLDRDWQADAARRLFTAMVLLNATAPELQVGLDGAASELAGLLPDVWRDRRLGTVPGTVLTGGQRSTVVTLTLVLAALSLLILVVTAANLGGVLLARAAASRRQTAVHLSMGAGRGTVVRRQLLEGGLLGLGASAMALGLYAWARASIAEVTLLPTLALRIELPLDAWVVTMVMCAGTVSGIVLATGPALWASRLDLAGALRDAGARSGDGRALAGMRRILVSTQVALTLVLVVGAALFTRSLQAMADADLGFPRAGLIALDFDLEPSSPAPGELPGFALEALRRVRALPGVIGAAMANRAPVDQSTPTLEVRGDEEGAASITDVTMATVTAGYFETVGIPLLEGRGFSLDEEEASRDVAIVNESLAERLWPGEGAVGRSLSLAGDRVRLRVVGVARDSKYRSITESRRPHVYRPTPPRLGLTLLARTAADQRETLQSIQHTLDLVGPGLIGFFPRTEDDHLVVQLLPAQAAAYAATLLGTLALVLSAAGLYGLVAWFVALRRREIGIRMALGANQNDIRVLIVGQALRAAAPGVAAGFMGAVALGLLARSALFGVAPVEVSALAAGAGALVIVIVLAAYGPSRRATSTDAASVLRD
jgi:predicted permease